MRTNILFMCTAFWNDIWLKISDTNTDIYETVFKCVPTNSVRNFESLKDYSKTPPICKANPINAVDQLKLTQVVTGA